MELRQPSAQHRTHQSCTGTRPVPACDPPIIQEKRSLFFFSPSSAHDSVLDDDGDTAPRCACAAWRWDGDQEGSESHQDTKAAASVGISRAQWPCPPVQSQYPHAHTMPQWPRRRDTRRRLCATATVYRSDARRPQHSAVTGGGGGGRAPPRVTAPNFPPGRSARRSTSACVARIMAHRTSSPPPTILVPRASHPRSTHVLIPDEAPRSYP